MWYQFIIVFSIRWHKITETDKRGAPSPSDPRSLTLSLSLFVEVVMAVYCFLSLSLHGGIKQSLSLSVIIVCVVVVVVDIHCILHCFVLSILSWHLCTHPPLAAWIFWSTGKTKGGPAVCAAVIHCWFVDCLFPADRWLTCHQDHHRLTLSPRSPLPACRLNF